MNTTVGPTRMPCACSMSEEGSRLGFLVQVGGSRNAGAGSGVMPWESQGLIPWESPAQNRCLSPQSATLLPYLKWDSSSIHKVCNVKTGISTILQFIQVLKLFITAFKKNFVGVVYLPLLLWIQQRQDFLCGEMDEPASYSDSDQDDCNSDGSINIITRTRSACFWTHYKFLIEG